MWLQRRAESVHVGPCRPWWSSGSILRVMGSPREVETGEYHVLAYALLCSELIVVDQEWK